MPEWIKVRTNLHEDPKVKVVKRHVRASNAHSVTGALLHLWSLGDTYTLDGELKGYTGADLDELVGIPRFAEALALPEVDWLELKPNSIVIKRFEKHNGASAKRRALAADRQQEHRNRNASVTRRTLPDKIRIDKRRKNPPNPPCGGNGSPEGETSKAPKGAGAGDAETLSPKLSPSESPGFSRWWAEYPPHDRKIGKAQCLRIWTRRRLEPIAEQVIAALQRAKGSAAWQKNGGEFVPLPTTWLNQTPWETKPSEQVRAPEGANGMESPRVYDV